MYKLQFNKRNKKTVRRRKKKNERWFEIESDWLCGVKGCRMLIRE